MSDKKKSKQGLNLFSISSSSLFFGVAQYVVAVTANNDDIIIKL